jgi:NAD(P)H-hydrate epimerase
MVRRYGGIAILKGACSLCFDGENLPAVCDRGNPGMATPGMGDVLTGVIAGLLAQLDDPKVAARAGMLVHALAGDMGAAQLGAKVERGLIASDLFAQLPICVNPQ